MSEQEEFEFRARMEAEAASQPAPAAAKGAPGWSEVPLRALKSLPKSTGNFVGGIYDAVRHPIDTLGNVVDLGAGALQHALPDALVNAVERFDPHPQAARQARAKASAVGQFYKERYGSGEGLRTTLADDPVGALSDASAVLTGGGGIAAKLPGLAKVGQAAQVAGRLSNPVNLAARGATAALPKLGQGAAAVIGNLGTHTGAESIGTAYKAGRNGGQQAQTLADNMRGNVPMTEALDAAKANLQAMGQQKAQAYRQGMAQVSQDQTALSFNGIDQAVKDAGKIGTYNGQVINAKAGQVHSAIAEAVEHWKGLGPQFHTPEGLDALKQQIGGIVDSLPFEEKTARLAGNNIYHAVKEEITRQAPTYARTMKQYSEATEQIREIERALSLGKKASVDTAMRKLQSLTRNNANTNYGNRLDLARTLEAQGGRDLLTPLAGQALSTITPRGLGGATAAGLGLGGYALGGPMLAAPMLALQSPRLMGEAALAAGKTARGVKKVSDLPKKALRSAGLDPATFANTLSVLGRQP